MLKTLLIFSIAIAGFGCAGGGAGPEGTGTTSAQSGNSVQGPVQLAFFDSRIFDDELQKSMQSESPEITVKAPGSFSLNNIPERVDRWLYSVKESGGKVVAKPENVPRTRGILSAVIDVVISLIDRIDDAILYHPSQNYDATLLYREDGTVSKIIFEKRRTDQKAEHPRGSPAMSDESQFRSAILMRQ